MNHNKDYFSDKDFKDMSPAALMYMQLRKPEMMKEVYNQAIRSGFALEPFVPNSVEPKSLIKCLRQAKYANDVVLRSEVLNYEDLLIDDLVDLFISTGNDTLVDHAVFILAFTKQDIVGRLIEALPNFKYPYTRSVACLIIGAKADDAALELLDKEYHYFKRHYQEEAFEQGPLFGLRLLFDRRQNHHDHDHDHHVHDESCNHHH